jgi:uncharacterized protein
VNAMEKQPAKIGVATRREFLPKIRSIDEKARTIEFVASTEAVDRYGDIIRTSGWKYQNYLKNPVFLWAHRSGDPPIGKCVDLKIESNPPALVQTIEFADAKTYGFADTIFNLFKNGFMRAVSVGFMPTEQPIPITDLEGYTTGYEFVGQELLELSAVPIPANQEALARGVQKGFCEDDLRRAFSGEDSETVYREIANASLDLAEIAVDTATKVVQEALAKVKAARSTNQESVDIPLDELLAAVKDAGLVRQKEEPEIDTIEALALQPKQKNGEIGAPELEEAVAESQTKSPGGSRWWRNPR